MTAARLPAGAGVAVRKHAGLPLASLHRLEAPPPYELWLVDLDAARPDLPDTLSADEHHRAARFVFERDRLRYVAAHRALRRLLATRTGLPASQLRFGAGPFGKPHLLPLAGSSPSFNLTHGGGAALVAIADEGEVGVDVELLHTLPDRDALARQLFTANEQRQLEATPPQLRDRAFLIGWTRKEACLKALGTGLSVEASAVDAGLSPERAEVRVNDRWVVVESVVCEPPAWLEAEPIVACARLLDVLATGSMKARGASGAAS